MPAILWAKRQLLNLITIGWWVFREFATDSFMESARNWFARWRPAVVAWDFLVAHPAIIVALVFVGITTWGYIEQKHKSVVKIPIPNRDTLFRAISEVQMTSSRLIMAQEQIDNWAKKSPDSVNTNLYQTFSGYADEYHQAMDKLHAEILVAGKHFAQLLHDLSGYISTQVVLKTTKLTIVSGDPNKKARILSGLEYIGRIASKVNETRNKIDEITGQAPDK